MPGGRRQGRCWGPDGLSEIRSSPQEADVPVAPKGSRPGDGPDAQGHGEDSLWRGCSQGTPVSLGPEALWPSRSLRGEMEGNVGTWEWNALKRKLERVSMDTEKSRLPLPMPELPSPASRCPVLSLTPATPRNRRSASKPPRSPGLLGPAPLLWGEQIPPISVGHTAQAGVFPLLRGSRPGCAKPAALHPCFQQNQARGRKGEASALTLLLSVAAPP